jgi:FMN phosphatase YigB (HAD superfamily)
MKKTLLLDFDGVILRSSKSTKLVSNRAARYVKNHTKRLNKESHVLNTYLYKTFGHTVTGLQRIGYHEANMAEYNDFVYNNIDFDQMAKDVETEKLYTLLEHCRSFDVDVEIFTNSPAIWHENILSRVYLPYKVPITNMCGRMKPDPQVYIDIEKRKPHHRLYFVDDSFQNFSTHTLFSDKWVNIMFGDRHIDVQNNIVVINDLGYIMRYVLCR